MDLAEKTNLLIAELLGSPDLLPPTHPNGQHRMVPLDPRSALAGGNEGSPTPLDPDSEWRVTG